MDRQQLKQENIVIPKQVFRGMIRDLENLLEDFEMISQQKMMRTVTKRIKDIEKKKVKGLTEKDFLKFIKREGIDVRQVQSKVPS